MAAAWALGHPFGATVARIISMAVKELTAMPKGQRAIVSICTDGGQGSDCLGRRDGRELLPLPVEHPDQVLLRVLRNDRADKRRQATDCQQRRSDYRPRYASPHWSLKTTSLRATRLTGPKRPTG